MKYLFILMIVIFSISTVMAEITYELSWDEDDIVNGDNFKIDVIVNGEVDELYDGKLWIEDDGEIISDIYDRNEKDWKSSYYYVNEYFEGSGDGQKIKLRIDEDNEDFIGDAYIIFKIRDEEEIREGIEVLEKEDLEGDDLDGENEEKIVESDLKDSDDPYAGLIEEHVKHLEQLSLEPILLGQKIDKVGGGVSEDFSSTIGKDINTENIVYQSRGAKIIEYSIYGFTLLCVLLCVLLIWRKLD